MGGEYGLRSCVVVFVTGELRQPEVGKKRVIVAGFVANFGFWSE